MVVRILPRTIIMLVTILGRPGCSWCRKARQLCNRKKIPYTYKDLDHASNRDLKHWMEVENLNTVPQIFIDGTHLGGFEVLEKHLSSSD